MKEKQKEREGPFRHLGKHTAQAHQHQQQQLARSTRLENTVPFPFAFNFKECLEFQTLKRVKSLFPSLSSLNDPPHAYSQMHAWQWVIKIWVPSCLYCIHVHAHVCMLQSTCMNMMNDTCMRTAHHINFVYI